MGSICLLWVSVQRVHAEPLRTVVRLADSADRLLLERIRGQTSDLDVRLLSVEQSPLEPLFTDQLATARALAEERAADVAIWFVRANQALSLIVADLRVERVLVRALAGGEGTLALSAQDEAGALVVRSALKASLSGAALGAPEHEVVAESTAGSVPPAPPPPPSPPAPPPPPPPRPVQGPRAAPVERPAWRLRVGLGAEAAFEQARPHGGVGLAARLGVARDRLELGARGGFGLRTTIEIPTSLARLSLAQHRVAGYAGLSVLARETVRLVLAVNAGAQWLTTRVRAEDASFRERDGRVAVAALGGDMMLMLLPRWTAGGGLLLRVGFEAHPQGVVLGYEDAGFVRLRRLWPVQPVVGLELVW